MNGLVRTGCANIGEFLFSNGVHDQVIPFIIDADQHAFVQVIAGMKKDFSPIL